MVVLTEKMLVIKAEKVPEFTAIMKKPMISKAFWKLAKISAKHKGTKSKVDLFCEHNCSERGVMQR